MKTQKLLIFTSLLIVMNFWGCIVTAQDTIIPQGADWKYLDDGSNQDTAWKELGYIDTSWIIGPAELGYGDGDEATVLSFGPDTNNKYMTYYFRHKFTVIDSLITPYLSLDLQRDDGAVVYLNGTEVVRSNMPEGSIDYLTRASSGVWGSAEDVMYNYLIPSDHLIADTNLLAVEIHQRSGSSSDISFNLELATTDEEPQIVRKAPYLIYAGIDTAMQILWQLNDTATCTLEWGADTGYSLGSAQTINYGSDHQHSYVIASLANNTKYYYQVIIQNDTFPGHFQTAPADDATQLTFLAYGDTRSNPDDHDSVASQILMNYINDPDAQSIITLSGDLINDGNTETDWDDQFFDPQYQNIQQMLRTIPMVACRGNHEGNGQLFLKYFPYPYDSSGTFYWSFDYGPVHFCVLDQYTSYSVGSTQYQWLVNDLSTSTKKWKVLVFHAPGWSAGGHSNSTSVQNIIQPLCVQYGVQLVLAGHNHYYARASVNQVEHITTGGGGAPLRTPDPGYPNIITVSRAHHFCKIEIDADTLEFTAIIKDGTTIENFIYHIHHRWEGTTDNDWNNTGNWKMEVVPNANSEVLVPGGMTYYPSVDTMVFCGKLLIESGGNVTIQPSGNVKLTGEAQK